MAHLPYSASGTARWLACPASVYASRLAPERTNDPEYTQEGTAAHKAAGEALEAFSKVAGFSDDETLVEAAQTYVDEVNYVRTQFAPDVEWIETMFSHPSYPDFGGTPDYVCVYRDGGLVILHVIDFKAGIGLVVDVEDNKQLLSYACVVAAGLPYEVDKFRLTIVQPRSYHNDDVQDLEVTPEEVEEHMQEVVGVIESPPGEYVPGPHCRWCGAADTCPALRDLITRAPLAKHVPEWVEIHTIAPVIRAVLEQIEDRLIEAARTGVDLPGLKVIDSRSRRFWAQDAEQVVGFLDLLGVPEEDAYHAPKLKSPSQIESLKTLDLTKKEIAESIKPLVAQKTTGMKVVPSDAKGTPVQFGDEFTPI